MPLTAVALQEQRRAAQAKIHPFLQPQPASKDAAAPGNAAAATKNNVAAAAAGSRRRPAATEGVVVAAAAGHRPEHRVAAGTAARTLAQCCVHPVETLKLRLMLRRAMKKMGPPLAAAARGIAAATGHTAASGSSVSAASAAASSGGAAVALRAAAPAVAAPAWLKAALRQGSLSAGMGGALLAAIPSGLVYFAVYEFCTEQLRLQANSSTMDSSSSGGVRPWPWATTGPTVHLFSAAAAAAAASVVRVPADVIRHRVQAGLDPGLLAAARAAWRRGGGPGGLWAGWFATILRDMPELALSFTLFELGRCAWQDILGRGGGPGAALPGGSKPHLMPWQHLVLGGGCGAVAAAITVPLDNLKTRVQCGVGLGGAGAGGALVCSAGAGGVEGLRRAAAAVMRESGPAGFAAGMGPRVAQAALFSAIFFCAYEALKEQLEATTTASAAAACPPTTSPSAKRTTLVIEELS